MIGRAIVRLDELGSTQDFVFRLGELGAREGISVVARYQRSGRGRAGRTWTASPGAALLFSVLLRPERSLPGAFSLLVADAIVETVAGMCQVEPQIKWPNDVLVGGRKLSGVLIQARGGMASLGIGLNLHTDAAELPEGATSIHAATGRTIVADELLRRLLPKVDERYRAVMAGDNSGLVRVEARLAMRGEQVMLQDGERKLRGQVVGLREDGALLLEVDGATLPVVSGELVRGPRVMLPDLMPGSGKVGIL